MGLEENDIYWLLAPTPLVPRQDKKIPHHHHDSTSTLFVSGEHALPFSDGLAVGLGEGFPHADLVSVVPRTI